MFACGMPPAPMYASPIVFSFSRPWRSVTRSNSLK